MESKFPLIVCLLIFCVTHEVSSRLIVNRSHVADSFRSLVSGVGSELARGFPRPRELLRQSKQLFIGLPERAVFGTIHQLCSAYISSDRLNPQISPEIEQMSFQLRTPCSSESFPIEEAEKILESPNFDVNKKLVLFVGGWTSTIESNSIAYLAKAYNCRGDYNFLALNASYFIDTLYSWSAFNTEEMGRFVAIGLEKLNDAIPLENIHLVGFSLGAHIVGSAGRYFQEMTGLRLPRITGLDPANPCFNEGEYLSGLQRGDADFVDVIHTNPGGLGKKEHIGDIDFYAGGFSNVKPGCSLFRCSHQRAWRYYGESIYPGHEEDFMATRCNSLRKVHNGMCSRQPIPMGFATPSSEKGIYVVPVKSKSPFGGNANPDDDIFISECGLCTSK
ncbi:vitellogenin-1-like [Musca autumnalis]|uniref:vitellogenin-1-like n=1 Tax=Musca autumnalis TaxID=221902 RepID=UPI003CEE0A41